MIHTPELWTPRKRKEKRLFAPPQGFGWTPHQGGAKSNPYPPPTSYPNLWQYLKGSNSTLYVPSSGSTATSWTDSSSSHNNAAGAVPGNANAMVAGTLAGYPAAVSTTAYQYMSSIAEPLATVFLNVTIFVVISPQAATAGRIVLDNYSAYSWSLSTNGAGAGTGYQWYVNNSHTNTGPCTGGTMSINTPTLLTANYNATSGVGILQQNGTTVATATFTPVDGETSFPVGILTYVPGEGSASGFACTYGGHAIYTDCKSGSDLTNLNRFYGHQYGISVP